MKRYYQYLIALTVLTYLEIEFQDNFIITLIIPMWIFLILTCSLVLFSVLTIINKKFKKAIYINLFLLLTVVISFTLSVSIVEKQEEFSKEKGKSLLLSIENYKINNGNYPEQLSELTPNYITQIPNTSMGVFRSIPYKYYTKRSDYALSFKVALGEYRYTGKTKRWYYDD